MTQEITLDISGFDLDVDEWYEKPTDLQVSLFDLIEEKLFPLVTQLAVYSEPSKFANMDAQTYSPLIVWTAYSERKEPSAELEEKFHRLADEWRKETGHLSSMTKLVMHPKYQSIIGMGPSVVPILLRELQERPDHWFWALRAITEQDPTRPEDAGDVQKMAEAWLKWAKVNGYL